MKIYTMMKTKVKIMDTGQWCEIEEAKIYSRGGILNFISSVIFVCADKIYNVKDLNNN